VKYSEAKIGRVFVIRLEHGDALNATIEKFAADHRITGAVVVVLGGAEKGSRLVVGPEMGEARPVAPMERRLDEAHEIAGVGTVFLDEDTGRPLVHLHVAAGRSGSTVTGCTRNGVVTWQVAEVVLFELCGTSAKRKTDAALGFKLLCP
jgi:predicted DNA-binding protein with PD1-like motif